MSKYCTGVRSVHNHYLSLEWINGQSSNQETEEG